jgi:hypothetical protein
MSTLAIVLTAAMVVPGNGPEMVSWEMEQGLDLSGEWEGVMKGMLANHDTFRLRCANGRIEVMHPRFEKAIIRWTAI